MWSAIIAVLLLYVFDAVAFGPPLSEHPILEFVLVWVICEVGLTIIGAVLSVAFGITAATGLGVMALVNKIKG